MFKVYRVLFSPLAKVDEVATVATAEDARVLISYLVRYNVDENLTYIAKRVK